MSVTETRERTAKPATAAAVDMKLEVIVLPVRDVERSKRFYSALGWRLDADFSNNGKRVVQFTPTGSPCSIHFGVGITEAAPGSVKGTYLVVDDIEAARAELKRNGADVSEPFHFDAVLGQPLPGVSPQRNSYSSIAMFSDPDGNSWLLQEIQTRLPGRGFSSDTASLTDLLREAENHHGKYEPAAPKHHWSGWYAGYVVARQRGKSEEEAVKEATRHLEGS